MPTARCHRPTRWNVTTTTQGCVVEARSVRPLVSFFQRDEFQQKKRILHPVLLSILADICRLHDPGAKFFACLVNWYLQTVAVITVATTDQSTLPHSPPRHRCGKAPAKTLFHLGVTTWSNSHSVAREDICRSMETLSAAFCSGRANYHVENIATFSESCHHTCRP